MQTGTATQTARTATGQREPEYKERSELEARIALRAYQIYEESGRIPGRDLNNWLQAEQEVLSEALDADFG